MLAVVLLAGALLSATSPAAASPAAPDVTEREALAARCEQGSGEACRTLGRALVLGDDAVQVRLGAAHVALACELGDAPACGDLGALHALGRGVAWDAGRAIALSRRACDAGVGLACANLGVLAVEEAGGLTSGKPAPEAVRRFRVACDAGAAEGCLDLAVALDLGAVTGGRRDREGAAGALRKACELGLALACHRLAVLISASDAPTAPAGGPVIAFAPELSAAACRAAIAPACEAARLPVPPQGLATPSARLVADPHALALGIPGAGGFHPADLTARAPSRHLDPDTLPPSPAVLAAVPPALYARLALDGASTSDSPPDPAVALLLPSRRLDLGQCIEAPRATPREPTRLALTFVVEPDGRTGAIRAASDPAEPEVEACAAALAAAWEFPIADRTLGPFVVVLDLEALPGGVAPGYPGPEGLRPAPSEAGCLAARARLPDGRVPARPVSLKFAVGPDGRAALVHAISPAPERLVAAAAEAVRACPWAPGAGADGRPALLWTTVTLAVGSR